MIRIAVDAYGGDHAPAAVIDGCIAALERFEDIELLLTGDQAGIEAELNRCGYSSNRIAISHAPEVIGCDEAPVMAIRKKKQSSIVKAMEHVRDNEAACLVSAGSTGALLAGATFIVKRIEGIQRPALGVALPSLNGCTLLMDSGANADCKSQYLQQFAVMASVYMQNVMGVAQPRIGLLNNGAEAEKGSELTKAAYKLLQDTPVNFTGNCEGRDILSGDFDAVICDGFAGNVVLKHTEGLASTLMKMLKKELMADTRSKLGAALAKPAFKRFKALMDYTEYGGAPLLGVNGGVIKAHGSSNAKAFAAAIGQARKFAGANVNNAIREAIADIPKAQD